MYDDLRNKYFDEAIRRGLAQELPRDEVSTFWAGHEPGWLTIALLFIGAVFMVTIIVSIMFLLNEIL